MRVSSRPPRPLAASVRGFPAWQFGLLLREPVKRRIAELERDPHVDPWFARELRAAYVELEQAGEMWRAWHGFQVSLDGSVSVGATEITTDSWQHDEISAEEAAVLLGVTASRVRQLARDGLLSGRKVGRAWLLSRSSVVAYAGTPRGVAA